MSVGGEDGATDQIVVAVRVRPRNARELAATDGKEPIVRMSGQQTNLVGSIASRDALTFGERARMGSHITEDRHFTFDHSMWSVNASDEHFVSQEEVYRRLGVGLLHNAFQGYNACIFAYGQTGAGKTHTMMGPAADPGLIPRICNAMFARMAENDNPDLTFKVECSYMEIYNERVRDLLSMDDRKASLRVREHKILGPYVDGLRTFAVNNYAAIEALISEGTKSRVTAATSMNDTSSRSHAVFSITLTQSQFDQLTQNTGEKTSRVSLVDLAGSERVSRTGAEGDRLKEGGSINKSLHTLGLVIGALADIAAGKRAVDGFVPYRDSVLTWLLRENLGGNSKTVMIANISPSADSYDETLSTLRYADCAKRIRTHAVINEDANARLIHDLRDEVERLRAMLSSANMDGVTVVSDAQLKELRERLAESERLMRDKTMSWEVRLSIAQKALDERQRQLTEMGISVQGGGISVDSNKMYLLNLNPGVEAGELTVYYLKDTLTRVGSERNQDIRLEGQGVAPEHCVLPVESGQLFVLPLPGAAVFVDEEAVDDKVPLAHGCNLRLGTDKTFRVSCPRLGSQTPLQPRADAESDDVSDALLSGGSWPGSKFHLACEKGELGLVQLMLKNGEDPNSEDARWKRAPIMLAADYGHLGVCQLLLTAGAQPGKVDERGYNAMHACCDTGHLDIVKLLMQAGAAVDPVAAVGCTPLHRAADQGHLSICQYLLDQGAQVNSRDRKGWSPLLLAALHGHLEVCQLLVARGADLRAVTQFNETALHMAAHIASIPLVQFLIQAGVDPTVEQLYQRTAYDYASETSSFSLLHSRIEFLVNREQVCRLLHPLLKPSQRQLRSLDDRKSVIMACASTTSALPLPFNPPRLLTTTCARPKRAAAAASAARGACSSARSSGGRPSPVARPGSAPAIDRRAGMARGQANRLSANPSSTSRLPGSGMASAPSNSRGTNLQAAVRNRSVSSREPVAGQCRDRI